MSRRKRTSVASTVSSVNMDETATELWSAEVEEKLSENLEKFDEILYAELHKFDTAYDTLLMQLGQDMSKSTIHIDDEKLRSVIVGCNIAEETINLPDETFATPPPISTVKRRRSRSIQGFKYPNVPNVLTDVRRSQRKRSCSTDTYKTPRNRVRVSTFTSTSKYTVCKPKKTVDSGFHMKRIMKPNEEAISTSGSPLYVYSGAVVAPHVNIPLPGGVVLNIEPKKPQGPVAVPELDEVTRRQLKILCEQLQEMY